MKNRPYVIALTALMVLLAVAPAWAQDQGECSQLEAATIKPYDPTPRGDGFITGTIVTPVGLEARGQTPYQLIMWAYNLVSPAQISMSRGWATSESLDVQAKAAGSALLALQKLSYGQRESCMRTMLQRLLADRFNLKVEYQQSSAQIFRLVVSPGGSKLKELPSVGDPSKRGSYEGILKGTRQIKGLRASMPQLARALMFFDEMQGRVVVDDTHLEGVYRFDMRWNPNFSPSDIPGEESASLFSALQDQLGLRLIPSKGVIQVLKVVGISRPSEN